MSYTLFVLPSAERDLDRFSRDLYQRIKKTVLRLEKEPRCPGSKKLAGLEGYRIRVGDWRILYRIEDAEKRVYVYRVKHRSEAYR